MQKFSIVQTVCRTRRLMSLAILFLFLLISACGGEKETSGTLVNGGDEGTNTVANNGESSVTPVGGDWQGTWAQQTLLTARDDASSFHKSFYSPTVHYRDADGVVFGSQFFQCMAAPVAYTFATENEWDFFHLIPGGSEILAEVGSLRNLFSSTALLGSSIEITGPNQFILRDSLFARYGLDVRKVSSNFLANTITLVDAPDITSNQYAACATFEWGLDLDDKIDADSINLAIPVTLDDGSTGLFTAYFSYAFLNGFEELQRSSIDDYTSVDPLFSFARLISTVEDSLQNKTIYNVDEPELIIDSLSDGEVTLTIRGIVDDKPIVVKAIVYPNPADWLETRTPSELKGAVNVFYKQAKNDLDGDGFDDSWDEFPDDPSERLDTDGDGVGNNADTDDDNDGTLDEDDLYPTLAFYGDDTDGDGQPDQRDLDDDGDGVPDSEDAFQQDPDETTDTDGDGIGNNTDTDDDGDGIADDEDLVPLDSRCGNQIDAVGDQCVIDLLLVADRFVQVGSVVYIASTGYNGLFPHILETAEQQQPVVLETYSVTDAALSALTYSKDHHRLYAGFSNGVITAVNINTGQSEYIHTLTESVRVLVDAGNYVLAQGDGRARALLEADGTATDSDFYHDLSTFALWNINNGTLVRSASPERIGLMPVDQASGAVGVELNSPDTGRQLARPPIAISPDGEYLLSSGGVLSSATTLERKAMPLLQTFDHLSWTDTAGLLTLIQGDASVLLHRYGTDFSLIDAVSYPGAGLGIFHDSGNYYVMTQTVSGPAVHRYHPSDDSDGDGVDNQNDAFPFDPAASIDTDRDGAPDQWNSGYSANDSTTRLELDDYPDDPACYQIAQGTGDHCDYSILMPTGKPDQFAVDSEGIVYMLFSDSNLIYRWNTGSQDYLTPIHVGLVQPGFPLQPDLMVYSADHKRLYLGYPNGRVTSLAVTDSYVEEKLYLSLPESIAGLADAGAHLLVINGKQTNVVNNYYSGSGQLAGSSQHYRGSGFRWNASNRRLFFVGPRRITPGDLYYDQLSASGAVVEKGETPYHGDYSIDSPVLVSPDGTIVLLGSGNYFDSTSLQAGGSITRDFTHGLFLPDGRLAVLTQVQDSIELAFYNSQLLPITGTVVMPGNAIGLVHHNGELQVFTHTDESGVSVTVIDPG